MPHSGDWLPSAYEKFVEFSQRFTGGLSASAEELGLDAGLVGAANTTQRTFMINWGAQESAGISRAGTAAKKALITGHRKFIRDFFNLNLRYLPALTDKIRKLMGVPIPDKARSRITVGNRLAGCELSPKGIRMVGMSCWDIATKAKKILYGMSGIVVTYAISDAPITDITLLTEALLITKTTHTFKCTDTQRGKWITVVICWQSKTGERGPGSAIQSTLIP
jgi:hypothetical protein